MRHRIQPQYSSKLNAPLTGLSVATTLETAPTRAAPVLAVVQIDQVLTERTLPFRAHDQAVTDQAGVYASAARKISFDDEYQQRKSVQEFVKSLGLHSREERDRS